jgi:hypothetical protein
MKTYFLLGVFFFRTIFQYLNGNLMEQTRTGLKSAFHPLKKQQKKLTRKTRGSAGGLNMYTLLSM